MGFNWFVLVPVSILNVILTSLILKLMQVASIAPTDLANSSLLAILPLTIVMLLKDVIIAFFIFNRVALVGREVRQEAVRVEEELLATAAGD
jgi:hypothetical protein